jgi:hypothetical protein
MKINALTGLILLTMLSSCKDFFEKDISKKTPVFILPLDNSTVLTNPVQFKWEELDGAKKYRIQIVSPSFSAIQSYALDSIISGTNFQFALDSNQYEVKLTALNAGYTSLSTTPIHFNIGTIANSSFNTVSLLLPESLSYVGPAFDGKFKWGSISNLLSYTFELHQGSDFSGTTEHFQDQIISNQIILNLSSLPEGKYTWGVKAFLSNATETIFSKRSFYIDTTQPSIAALISPANASFASTGLITFSWSRTVDLNTLQAPVNSILEVSTVNTFSTLVSSVEVSNLTTNLNLIAGNYFWRVKSIDIAGNIGVVSPIYSLTILP